MAIFNWIITAAVQPAATGANYTISSTDNPFALNFSNVSMQLLDRGLDTERYTFSLPMNKTVIPSVAITNDNSMATCFYNTTIFKADLYTRLAKSYPPSPAGTNSNSTAATSTGRGDGNSATAGFDPWPYAVRIEETIAGGADVPACYKTVNGNIGDRTTNGLGAKPPDDVCSCLYKNWDP